MVKIEFTEQEIEQLYQQFMEHSGLVKKKLHVIYLKALKLPHHEISRIARIGSDAVTRYLKEYNAGGLEARLVSYEFIVLSVHCSLIEIR